MKIAHNQNKELQLKLMTNLILWNQFLQKGKKQTNKQTKKKHARTKMTAIIKLYILEFLLVLNFTSNKRI